MRVWAYAVLSGSLLLAGCSGPDMEVRRAFSRGIIIENADDAEFMIERVVANKSPQDSNCNNYPNKMLRPGESHTVVFLLCGTVSDLEVVTDKGTSSFSID